MSYRPSSGNAATRLYLLLERARSLPDDLPAPQGWANAFEVEPKSVQHWLQIIGSIDRLVSSVEAGLATSPHASAVASGFQEVVAVRDRLPELNETIGYQLQPLHDTGMQSLLFCSSLLGDVEPLQASADDVVTELLDRTRSLKDDVSESDAFSDVDRRALLEALQALENTLLAVDLVGMEDVSSAADSLAGALVRRPTIAATLRNSPLAKNILNLVTLVDLFLNGAANVHELTAPDPSPLIVQITEYHVHTDVAIDLTNDGPAPLVERSE